MMAFNGFWIKKYIAFGLCGVLPTITFFLLLVNYGLVMAAFGFTGGVAIAAAMAAKISGNPWQAALEGKGLLVGTFDSTGVIKTYLAQVNLPFLKTKIGKETKNTIFSRDAMLSIKAPQKAVIDESETELKITLAKDKFVQSIFSFDGMPLLFYNKALGDFYTKELLAKFEKETFVEHTILYLTRRIEDLSSQVRDFARYIVEQTRPKSGFLEGKLVWVVIVIVLIIVAALAWPMVSKALVPLAGSVGQAIPASMISGGG